jgi:hypothetical protein
MLNEVTVFYFYWTVLDFKELRLLFNCSHGVNLSVQSQCLKSGYYLHTTPVISLSTWKKG